MDFHEKILNFQKSLFLSSDKRFNALAYTCMDFHEKILNFQSLLFSYFSCEIQCIVMHLHLLFSWKNIELSKFTFFLVRCEIQSICIHMQEFSWKNIKLSKFNFFFFNMTNSMHCHALAWIFIKKYWNFKVHCFLS